MTSPVLLPENAITIVRGSSKTYELIVTDDGPGASGKAVDLTGARVVFSVKRDIDDPETAVLIRKDSQTDVTQAEITLPREGKARIYLVPADTQTFAPAEYVFDVWVFLPNGKRYPVIPPSIFNVTLAVTLVP